jgi:hypothetical protein
VHAVIDTPSLTESVSAEEESKRRLQEKSNTAKKRKQKRKAKKKGTTEKAGGKEDMQQADLVPQSREGLDADVDGEQKQADVKSAKPMNHSSAEISDSLLTNLRGRMDYQHSAPPSQIAASAYF